MTESADVQSSDEEMFSMHNLKEENITTVDPITIQLNINDD